MNRLFNRKYYIIKLLLIIILSSIYLSALGQQKKKVQISVKVNSSIMPKMRIYKYGVNDRLKGMHLDTVIPIQPYRINHFSLSIPNKGVYGIQDAALSSITHKLFLRSGDSIRLTFNTLSNSEKQLEGLPHILTRHQMIAKARYPGNLIFFDSIARKLPLKYGRIKDESLKEYKIRCDSVYKIWLEVLKKMVRQKKVSDDFIAYAKAELSAKYVTWLAGPAGILPEDAFPHNYFILPSTFTFDQSKYMQSLPDYGQAAFLINKYFSNDPKNNRGYSKLKKQFSDIIKQHTGIVRDQLMAIKLKEYASKNDTYFDTAYTSFLKYCSNTAIKKAVETAVTASILQTKGNEETIKWDNVPDHTLLYDADGGLTTLKQLTKDTDKFYLIDCWATWCAPCRLQMPYVKEIESKYQKQIKVISISFDQQRKSGQTF